MEIVLSQKHGQSFCFVITIHGDINLSVLMRKSLQLLSIGLETMEILKAATLLLAGGVEAGAAIVIGFAALQALLRSMLLFIPRPVIQGEPDAKEAVRLRLGRWLAVALELELGADILRTAVAPTWNEIGQLGAIVVLRTALNFFLQQEIDKAETRNNLPPRATVSSAVPVNKSSMEA